MTETLRALMDRVEDIGTRIVRVEEKIDTMLERLEKIEASLYNTRNGIIVEVTRIKERERDRDRRDKIIIGFMSILLTIQLVIISLVLKGGLP